MRKLIGSLVMAGLATAGALVAATPAQAIPPNQFCELFVLSVTADDVLNDGGSDAVFVKPGTFKPVSTVDMFAGQTKPASAFGHPSDTFVPPATMPVSVFVKLGSSSKQIGATAKIGCTVVTGATRTFTDGDATYRVKYTVIKEIV